MAIADIDAKALDVLAVELGAAHGETNVLAVATDVSRLEEVVRLRERVYEAWGEVGRCRFSRARAFLTPLFFFCCCRSLCCSIMPRYAIQATRLRVSTIGRPLWMSICSGTCFRHTHVRRR